MTQPWSSGSLRTFARSIARPLDWLNSRTDADTEFFGVVLELIQIDNSRPAIQFRAVAAPNTWRKEKAKSASGKTSPRGEKYRAFFQELLDELREKHRFTSGRRASATNWYGVSGGVAGIMYSASFAAGGRCRAEIYIDRGDEEQNRLVFEALKRDAAIDEAAFGAPLTWERLEGKRACRIATYRDGSIEDDPDVLAEIKDWLIDRLLRLKRVYGDKLSAVVASVGS